MLLNVIVAQSTSTILPTGTRNLPAQSRGFWTTVRPPPKRVLLSVLHAPSTPTTDHPGSPPSRGEIPGSSHQMQTATSVVTTKVRPRSGMPPRKILPQTRMPVSVARPPSDTPSVWTQNPRIGIHSATLPRACRIWTALGQTVAQLRRPDLIHHPDWRASSLIRQTSLTGRRRSCRRWISTETE